MNNYKVYPVRGFDEHNKETADYELAIYFERITDNSTPLCWGVYFVSKEGFEYHKKDFKTQKGANNYKDKL